MGGGTYLGWGYLPWPGVPTLAGGTYLGWGYLPWLGGTYLGRRVPTLAKVGTPLGVNRQTPVKHNLPSYYVAGGTNQT